jgi:hypothetical protein
LKKFDRDLVNVKWICDFTGLETCFLPFGISDHSPMLVKMASLLKRKIPFKFFDVWAGHSLFLPLISKAWGKEVTPMFVLCNKLENVKGGFSEPLIRSTDVNHVITWSRNPHAKTPITGKLSDCASKVSLSLLFYICIYCFYLGLFGFFIINDVLFGNEVSFNVSIGFWSLNELFQRI